MWLMKRAFTLYRNQVSHFPLYKLIINDSQSLILTDLSHKHTFIINSEEVTPICRHKRISESVRTHSHTPAGERFVWVRSLYHRVREGRSVWCSTCPAQTPSKWGKIILDSLISAMRTKEMLPFILTMQRTSRWLLYIFWWFWL